MRTSRGAALFVGLLLAGSTALAQGHASSAQTNEANNPLTPKITLNLHDQWAPDLYDLDGWSNLFMLKGVIPHKIGRPELLRFTMPVLATAPGGSGDEATGLGDLNVMELLPFKAGHVEIGMGPQFTIPTATEDETGTGKWQAGLAVLVIAPHKWGLTSGLVTWQHSFAGDDARATQNNLSVQPLFIYNLPKGYYLRSTATMNFDLERDHYVVPVGAGVGKVFVKPSGTTINIFAEPQFTLAHDGAGQPKFQLFAGINLQFKL